MVKKCNYVINNKGFFFFLVKRTMNFSFHSLFLKVIQCHFWLCKGIFRSNKEVVKKNFKSMWRIERIHVISYIINLYWHIYKFLFYLLHLIVFLSMKILWCNTLNYLNFMKFLIILYRLINHKLILIYSTPPAFSFHFPSIQTGP